MWIELAGMDNYCAGGGYVYHLDEDAFAGGYRFTDFLRIGLPMNCIILAANVLICCILYPLY